MDRVGNDIDFFLQLLASISRVRWDRFSQLQWLVTVCTHFQDPCHFVVRYKQMSIDVLYHLYVRICGDQWAERLSKILPMQVVLAENLPIVKEVMRECGLDVAKFGIARCATD